MKKFIAFLIFASAHLISHAQCSAVTVQVTFSDTTTVQLFHPGFSILPSGFDNICDWEVTFFGGDIIHQETTSGGFNDQTSITFNHSVPITDSMKVTLLITNPTEGFTCTIEDTLYWKEIEVLPGSFIGDWAVLSSNGGVEGEITTATKRPGRAKKLKLFPSPAHDHFCIDGKQDAYSFSLLNVNGQPLGSYSDIPRGKKVDLSHYPSGLYFVQFRDEWNRNTGIKKIIKR